MSAVMVETPEQAARRLAGVPLSQGFRPVALHAYQDASGEPQFWRMRLKHPDGRKWMRPLRRDGVGFSTGEPDPPAQGKWLYRLPELLAADPAAVVYVVEGEGCADALAQAGIVATTSGSADSANAADWTPLTGRRVRLWPDNDAPGGKYAATVSGKLRTLGCRVEVVKVEALNLLDKGDAVDWLAANPSATAADVLSLPVVVAQPVQRQDPSMGARGICASAPEPLRRPFPPAAPYPLEALGDVLGAAAARVHAVVQAPAAMCGQSFLSAASLAAQAHGDMLIDGRREPLSLWHVTVGESGERKSAADSWALRMHREVEREQADAYRLAMIAHDIAATAYKAAARAAEGGKGKKDAAAIRAALSALGAPPEPPLAPWLLIPEATLEGLHKLYQSGRPSLGLFNDDAGDFLDGHAMNRENRTKSAAGFSKLWDDGQFSRIRAGDGAAKFYGRRLALHVMVQPVIAERALSDDVLCGQGFLPRALLSWPETTVGTRHYDETNLSTDAALTRYWSRMRDLLTSEPVLRQGTRNELEPRALSLAPDAKAYWIEVANAIEHDMAGEFANVRAWGSKAAAQVLRIAGVLTLVEEPGAGMIRLATVERAARLALYHLGEAARVIGTASVPPKVRHAEALLTWCRETGRTLLYSSDAMHKGPNVIRTNEAFTVAADVLEATGWAEYCEGGAVLDGKHRARVWRIRIGEGD